MTNFTFTLLTALLLAPLAALHAAEGDSPQLDLALQPAHVIVSPWPQYIPPTKRQGVAGIERTAKGRLWAIYGRDVESTRTYQVLKTSADDGQSWSEVQLMVLPREGTRAMSANVWIDPLGRLWLFWGQTAGMNDGRFGVWAIVADDPDAAEPKWSAPRRLGDGILLNIYDYNRTPEGAIHMATFREEDVRAGKPVTDKVRLRVLIDRLPHVKPRNSYETQVTREPDFARGERSCSGNCQSVWVQPSSVTRLSPPWQRQRPRSQLIPS